MKKGLSIKLFQKNCYEISTSNTPMRLLKSRPGYHNGRNLGVIDV